MLILNMKEGDVVQIGSSYIKFTQERRKRIKLCVDGDKSLVVKHVKLEELTGGR